MGILSINDTTIKNVILSDFRFLLARILAERSHLDAAQALLEASDQCAATTSELDLAARIALAKGDTQKARELWAVVLSKEPNHAGAMLALRRLGPYWLFFAIIRRSLLICSPIIVLLLGAVGAKSLIMPDRNTPDISQVSDSQEQAAATSIHQVDSHQIYSPLTIGVLEVKPVAIPTPERTALSSIQPITQMSLKTNTQDIMALDENIVQPKAFFDSAIFEGIDGVVVSEAPECIQIAFKDSVFSTGVTLTETATAVIIEFAHRIAQEPSETIILIEGHTDAVPMNHNSPFVDNFSLGVYRALAVANVIRNASPTISSRLVIRPVPALKQATQGDQTALPDPLRRTAVISIVPWHSGVKAIGSAKEERAWHVE